MSRSVASKRAVQSYDYTVHLRVQIYGADAEWEHVAERLAHRVEGLSVPGGFVIVRAEVDSSADAEAEE